MKSLLSSKTFWLAVIQSFVGVAVIFETAYPEVGWLVVVKSILDIALRYITSEPVALTGK